MAAFDFPNSPSNGDTYTANGVTFQWNGSVWIRYSASMGAQGSTGPTGAQGAVGSTGAQGATGSGGSTGAQGAAGPTGAQGATAAAGAQGAAGSNGGTDIVNDTSPQLGGNLDCNNFVVTLNDSTGSGNNRFKIGNAGDLQIFHLSNANYVSGEVDGKDLYVRSRRDLHLVCGNNASGYRNVIYADNNGTARLYHPASNAVRLQTSTAGVSITGALNVTTTMHIPDDSNGLQLGDSNDLRVRHDGNNSIISHSGTGDLLINTAAGEKIYIDSSEVIIRNAASNETMIQATENSDVELYHNGSIRAYTAADGFALSRVNTFSNPNNTGSETLGAMLDIGGNIHFQEVHPTGAYTDRCDLVLNTNSGYGLGLSDKIRITAGGRVVIYSSTQRTYNKGWAPGNLTLQNNSSDGTVDFAEGILFTDNANNQGNGGWMHAGIVCVGTTGYNGNICFGVDGNGVANNNTSGITERMRIVNNGTVRIKCEDMSADPWTSNRGVLIGDSSTGTIFSNGSATGTANNIIFGNGNGLVGKISTNGSTTTYHTSSDYRLKENAVPISDGIARLKTLKPYKFNFKADSSTTLDGFFAHEVSSAVPEAVDGEKDELYTEAYLGYKEGDQKIQTLDSAKLIPLLTAALKDVLTKVETLETKVAALEGS